MKKNFKTPGATGVWTWGLSLGGWKLMIKNVNKFHYPYFLITCWLQSGIQAEMGDERCSYCKVYAGDPIIERGCLEEHLNHAQEWWDTSGARTVPSYTPPEVGGVQGFWHHPPTPINVFFLRKSYFETILALQLK